MAARAVLWDTDSVHGARNVLLAWAAVGLLLGCSLDLDRLRDAGPEGASDASVDAGDASVDAGGFDGGLGERVTQIAAGGDTTCALTSQARLFCWGDNRRGQLQQPGGGEQSDPVEIQGARWVQVSVGDAHVCAIDLSGFVDCWGDNTAGQTGATGTTMPHVPNRITAPNDFPVALDIAAGANHTCAIFAGGAATSGRVHCWGANGRGQLGDGTSDPSPMPRPVDSMATARDVEVGTELSCAVLELGGTVACWGDNQFEQIGDNTPADRHLRPRDLAIPSGPTRGGLQAAALSVGPTHACAQDVAKVEREVYCWGDNRSNQITADVNPNFGRARVIGVPGGAVSVAAGGDAVSERGYSCAINDNGLLCRGAAEGGALGIGGDCTSRNPVEQDTAIVASGLPSADTLLQVVAGRAHTCVLSTEGLYCTGANGRGQIMVEDTTTCVAEFRLLEDLLGGGG